MGSSGTGHFSDYSGSSRKSDGSGGVSGEDKCGKAFSTDLEEVERVSYYRTHGSVPPLQTEIQVIFEKRLAVATVDGEIVGYLPTSYNYLRACLEEGFSYVGIIRSSAVLPLPRIAVDIAPVEASK